MAWLPAEGFRYSGIALHPTVLLIVFLNYYCCFCSIYHFAYTAQRTRDYSCLFKILCVCVCLSLSLSLCVTLSALFPLSCHHRSIPLPSNGFQMKAVSIRGSFVLPNERPVSASGLRGEGPLEADELPTTRAVASYHSVLYHDSGDHTCNCSTETASSLDETQPFGYILSGRLQWLLMPKPKGLQNKLSFKTNITCSQNGCHRTWGGVEISICPGWKWRHPWGVLFLWRHLPFRGGKNKSPKATFTSVWEWCLPLTRPYKHLY